MPRIILSRIIDAPLEVVFTTVAEISEFSKAIPRIVDYEFLSDIQSGAGTRFRETRRFKNKDTTTDLEITEFVKNEHVRIVTDSHGTVWDTVFSVHQLDEGVELTLKMDALAHRLLPKLMNPLVMGMIKKVIAKDMDDIKNYCEEN